MPLISSSCYNFLLMDLLAIFLTGLLTGGLTCMAVQGGLLTATLAQRENNGSLFPILSFLIAKLISYTLLGFALGLLGSIFRLSISTQVILQITIAIFMIGTALNILNVHPVFRYFIIQPPRILLKLLRNQTKSNDIFAPAIVGTFTVFIPCGTTQAMMALALGTGNPWYSAAVLFAFTLGTSPLFVIFGLLASKLNTLFENSFMKVAAYAIILLALYNINNAVSLSGSKYNLSFVFRDFSCTVLSVCPQVIAQNPHEPVRIATIYLKSDGYSPNSITLARNSHVKINLINEKGAGCIQAFTIPSLNVQKIVRQGTSELIAFKTPDKPQDIKFTCSMGMYEGVIHII